MRIWSPIFVLALVLGCTSAGPPMPPADHTYTTRGVVERLETRNDEHLLILHEEIPDFVGIDGNPAPMHSMSMPFAVAEGVSQAGVRVGSKLEFTFEVRWEGGPPLLATRLRVLPEDAKLDLSR